MITYYGFPLEWELARAALGRCAEDWLGLVYGQAVGLGVVLLAACIAAVYQEGWAQTVKAYGTMGSSSRSLAQDLGERIAHKRKYAHLALM